MNLLESLQQLGLTLYESKVLVTLTHNGSGTVADIHYFSGVPRSAIYGVLTKLKNKGIIETQNTKPMKYKVIEPQYIIDRLILDYKKAADIALNELEKLSVSQENENTENGGWNITGIKNVHEKILQLVESAQNEIVFASAFESINNIPKNSHFKKKIFLAVNSKIKEGINVRITAKNNNISFMNFKEVPEAEVRVYQQENTNVPLKGGILIVDNKEVLIISIKDDIIPVNLNATWYNAEEQVSIFKHFIEMEWKTSKSVKLLTILLIFNFFIIFSNFCF